MWRPALIVVAVAVAGCGGDDPPSPPPRPVQLEVVAPADGRTVESGHIEVRGRVVPAEADVQVLGRRVDVTGGRFATEVELEEGANLVDVAASAGRRRPASTAVRVVRVTPVEIPELEGEDAEEAIEQLEDLRLEVEIRRGGGLLDDLLPGDRSVCALDPPAGTEVRPGSTVTVEVARSC
jgi:beta-lactam-binding protein with PASTA domain